MNKIVKDILAKRGFKGEQEINRFLNPDYGELADPFSLPDMELAAKRVVEAIERKEKIAIYGDYDVDGIAASTLLLEALQQFGANNPFIYTPDRFSEGYGVNESAVKKLARQKVKLIVTVDCGSLSHQEIKLANQLGVDVVVTDHHGVADVQPPALAVVNPHRTDRGEISFQDYCGAGVAFQLVRALQTKLTGLKQGQEKWLLDLVALATISDIVPLIGDNRTLVYWGLQVLSKTRRLGLKALMAVARVNSKKLSARDIGFILGPRLNAAGRLDTAELALRLLQTRDNSEALELAEQLDQLNLDRRKEQDRIFQEVVDNLVSRRPTENVLVVSGKGWSHGIVGIVAGKVVEMFGKPVFVLEELADGTAKGSGRSFGDFKLNEAIAKTSKLLIKGGGHAAAAGVTVKTQNIADWRRAMNDYYSSLKLKDQARYRLVTPDVERNDFLDLTVDLVHEMRRLEPFGFANEEPVFKLLNAKVGSIDRIGSDNKHLKMTVADKNGRELKLLAFNAPDKWFTEPGDHADLAISLDINEWQGKETVEGRILEMHRE